MYCSKVRQEGWLYSGGASSITVQQLSDRGENSFWDELQIFLLCRHGGK